MASQLDQYGREILSEKIDGGGERYFTADRSICVGLRNASDAEALRLFNATPPSHLVPVEVNDPLSDDLIEKIEAMTPSQRQRLKRALLKVQE